jgi:hypothetical protein
LCKKRSFATRNEATADATGAQAQDYAMGRYSRLPWPDARLVVDFFAVDFVFAMPEMLVGDDYGASAENGLLSSDRNAAERRFARRDCE